MPVERATPERAEELVHNYQQIVTQVEQATQKRGPGPKVRLESALYQAAQRAPGPWRADRISRL
jgi:ABC-type Fe3+-hydroxamate transport system substrate-binding protein